MSDDRNVLIDMAKMLGALDSKLDSVEQRTTTNYHQLHEELREFRNQYSQNAQTNRDHSIKVEARINDLEQRKLDRDDPDVEPARKLGWIINNWKWVLIITTIAGAIGIKMYHGPNKDVVSVKETIGKVLKGGTAKPQ